MTLPDRAIDWLHAMIHNLTTQQRWNQKKEVRDWITRSRLDGYGAAAMNVAPSDAERLALRQRYKVAAGEALAQLPTLLKNLKAAEHLA